MARTSSVYYIAPSAISIVPNCNGTASDLAVSISRGTKVRVYYPPIYALGMVDGTYQEWTLRGRNRRLAEPEKPYTIYARLRKAEDPTSSTSLATAHANAYLVFAAQVKNASNEWTDPYILSANNSATSPLNNVTGADGSKYNWPAIPARQTEQGRTGYWWVKMGTVSAPDENNQRTVDLDTGILGTEEYNAQWRWNPDDLPDNPVRTVITDRGSWAATPHVIYRGPTGTCTPDGTLPAATAAALGWQGTEPLTFTNGEPIAEPYHRESLTRHRFIAKRLNSENAALTDAELYEKLTTVSKGWEEENELETSRVWHHGILWECLVDATTEEPSFGCTDWAPIGGDMSFRLAIVDGNGVGVGGSMLVPRTNVNATLIGKVMRGLEDVSLKVTTWRWDMIGGDGSVFRNVASTRQLVVNDALLPSSWQQTGNVSFVCHATIGGETHDANVKLASTELSGYEVEFSGYVDVITVDDVGNCIGGLYTVSGDNDEHRSYRIHSAITVRKNGTPLLYTHPTGTLVDGDEERATIGHYKIYAEGRGCSCVIEDSTLYITSIDNIKDGAAGTADDQNFDYDAMRSMDSCSVDLVIDVEGKGSIPKSFPVTIKHDSQPFIAADLSNMMSGISWNTKTQSYVGLPIATDVNMWHNDERLDIESTNDISLVSATPGVVFVNGSTLSAPAPSTIYYSKSIITEDGHKYANVSFDAMGVDLPANIAIDITVAATYAGVRYERTLRHTINKGTDVNVYSIIPAPNDVAVTDGVLSSDTVACKVWCDSSDDKHYEVLLDANGKNTTHKLMLCWQRDTDVSEQPYTGAVSITTAVKHITFKLYGLDAIGDKDATTVHDTEDVPVLTAGRDGVSIESYIESQEAWGDSPNEPPQSGWADSTPTKNAKYLWRRTRKMVLNAERTAYTTAPSPDGDWKYQRLDGTDGTSISTKGTVAVVSMNNLPMAGVSVGDLGIIQGFNNIYIKEQNAWAIHAQASDGDSYTVKKDNTVDLEGDGTSTNLKNHLLQWVAEVHTSDSSKGWVDLGEFKGDDGVTYFTHIAWADETSGTFSGTIPAGQLTIPNKGSVGNFSISPLEGYCWMGVLVNQSTQDPTGADKLLYEWQYLKGEQGDNGKDAVRYWLQPSTNIVKVIDDDTNPETTPATLTVKLMKTEGDVTIELSSIPQGLADGMRIELYFDGVFSLSYADNTNPSAFYNDFGQGMSTAAFASFGNMELRLRARTKTTVYDTVTIVTMRPTIVWKLEADVTHFRFSRDYAGVLTGAPADTTIRATKSCDNRQTVYDNASNLPSNMHLGWVSPNHTWQMAPRLGTMTAATLMTFVSNTFFPQTSIGLYSGGTVQSDYTVTGGTLVALLTFTAEIVPQRMLIPAGEWNAQTTYRLTDTTCPLVLYQGRYYYLLADTSTNNHPTDGQSNMYWALAAEYDVILTKMLFALFAKFGSFVVYGDYFFSQYGTLVSNTGAKLIVNGGNVATAYGNDGNGNIVYEHIYGESKVPYGWFNASDPMGSNYDSLTTRQLLFVPSLVMDAMTGETWFAGGKVHFDYTGDVSIEGTVRATNMFRNICLFYKGDTSISDEIGVHDNIALVSGATTNGSTLTPWFFLKEKAEGYESAYGDLEEGELYPFDEILREANIYGFEGIVEGQQYVELTEEYGFLPCSAYADMVFVGDRWSSNSEVQWPNNGIVWLPPADLFPGKMIEVVNRTMGTGQARVKDASDQGIINYPIITNGVIAREGNNESQNIDIPSVNGWLASQTDMLSENLVLGCRAVFYSSGYQWIHIG